MPAQINPRAMHMSPGAPVGQAAPGFTQSPPLTEQNPAATQVPSAQVSPRSGSQVVAGKVNLGGEQIMRCWQGPLGPHSRPLAVQARSPPLSGKNCRAAFSPAE